MPTDQAKKRQYQYKQSPIKNSIPFLSTFPIENYHSTPSLTFEILTKSNKHKNSRIWYGSKQQQLQITQRHVKRVKGMGVIQAWSNPNVRVWRNHFKLGKKMVQSYRGSSSITTTTTICTATSLPVGVWRTERWWGQFNTTRPTQDPSLCVIGEWWEHRGDH